MPFPKCNDYRAIASGESGAKGLYAMGRESILPNQIFGYLSPRYRTPVYNIVTITVIALCELF